MTHTVVWTPAAERQLAAIWLATTNRGLVTAAANQIDEILRTRAGDAGES